MEFKHRDDEFIEQRIEKVVFIETKQYKELTEGPVYGKYFEDTGVYNVFREHCLEKDIIWAR